MRELMQAFYEERCVRMQKNVFAMLRLNKQEQKETKLFQLQ